MKKIIIVLVALIVAQLNATVYRVSNPDEIKTTMYQAQPGDTLLMRDGEWKDARIVFEGIGNADAPIVLRAETPGALYITGRSNLRIAGQHLIVEGLYFVDGYSPSKAVVEFRNGSSKHAHNCRLTSCAIVDFNPPSRSTDYKWVSMYGQYNRVDHCYFEGKDHSGTTLVVWMNSTPDYHLIDHNYFANRPDLGQNGGETIRVGTSSWSMYDSYTTVEYNYFEECNGEIEIISNKSCENIYRYNTFYECRGAMTLRHGNRCSVYGNFFFGNGIGNTGGIRIIGEDHLIYNNYFQDLSGTGFRAALSFVNGVPDSPLNRYFQVKNARVLFNSLVNCFEPIVLGAGSDSERTLPPKDCLIANNLIYSKYGNDIVNVDDEPINLTWQGNIFYGDDLGIAQPDGITLTDPLLVWSEDSLYRPAENSPAIDAAEGDYAFINEDFDGHVRTAPFDVGGDERSTSPVVRQPVGAADTGPAWYPPPPLPEKVRYVQAVHDSLRIAIQQADEDEIIELIDAGVYTVSAALEINKPVTIRVADSLESRPVIQSIANSDSLKTIFEMQSKGILRISGVELNGSSDSGDSSRWLIRSDADAPALDYSVVADDCFFRNAGTAGQGGFISGFAGSLADTIRFENCLFSESGGIGISFADESLNSGAFNVGWLGLTNCTMWNVNGKAVDVYAGDDVPFTNGPVIRIDHCTFDRCALDSSAVINARECDFTTIRNSIFSNNPAASAVLYGYGASIAWTDLYQSGEVQLERNAWIGEGMIAVDPGYADAENGDFSLSESSPVLGKAEDGLALGDLRWAEGVTAIALTENEVILPSKVTILPNYPNPFNAVTKIPVYLPKGTAAKVAGLKIYNALGQQVALLMSDAGTTGMHIFRWDAEDLPSGIYFAVLSSGATISTRKLVLIK